MEPTTIEIVLAAVNCLLLLLNLGLATTNYFYMKKRDRESDFISNLTEYRLKWIDLARTTIGDYLCSLDKLSRGDDSTLVEDYANYLKMHWNMDSFLTTKSNSDKEARELLAKVYSTTSSLIDSACVDRKKVREDLKKQLAEGDIILRELMDRNWADAKRDILDGIIAGKKSKTKKGQKKAPATEDCVVMEAAVFSTEGSHEKEKELEYVK